MGAGKLNLTVDGLLFAQLRSVGEHSDDNKLHTASLVECHKWYDQISLDIARTRPGRGTSRISKSKQ